MSGGDVRTDIGDGPIFERERTDDGAYCRGLDDIRASEDDRCLLYTSRCVYETGEGVIASRVRQIVGKDVPIAASMDLHGCISDQMCIRDRIRRCAIRRAGILRIPRQAV